MKFNYNKLRGRIREILGSELNFCNAMPMTRSTLSLKLNGKVEFTQSEIIAAMEVLQLPMSAIGEYFFNREFGKTDNNSLQKHTQSML